MGEVVLLELAVPEGQVLVVEEVVRQVVADVAEDTAAEDRRRRVPVPVEDRVGQLPERRCQHYEQRRWHYESVLVHGQVVVHAV